MLQSVAEVYFLLLQKSYKKRQLIPLVWRVASTATMTLANGGLSLA